MPSPGGAQGPARHEAAPCLKRQIQRVPRPAPQPQPYHCTRIIYCPSHRWGALTPLGLNQKVFSPGGAVGGCRDPGARWRWRRTKRCRCPRRAAALPLHLASIKTQHVSLLIWTAALKRDALQSRSKAASCKTEIFGQEPPSERQETGVCASIAARAGLALLRGCT